MLRAALTAICLLYPLSAAAGNNVFNASLDHPTIARIITEFETVCLPFIAHETKLTAEQNRAVFQSRMVEAGYEFDEEKEWNETFPLNGFSYVRSQCGYPDFGPPRVEGKFTVFPHANFDNASNLKAVGETDNQTCEIIGGVITPRLMTRYTARHYRSRHESPVSAKLVWQDIPEFFDQIVTARKNMDWGHYQSKRIRTTFPPASACTVHLQDKTLTLDRLQNQMIAQDTDWRRTDVKTPETKEIIPNAYSWTQCTTQDEEHYVYSVSLNQGSLSMRVKTLQDDKQAPSYNCRTASEAG